MSKYAYPRRKFLAVVVIANIAIYAIFLLLLMTMAIHFSAYSPDPLEQEDSVKRLIVCTNKIEIHFSRNLCLFVSDGCPTGS